MIPVSSYCEQQLLKRLQGVMRAVQAASRLLTENFLPVFDRRSAFHQSNLPEPDKGLVTLYFVHSGLRTSRALRVQDLGTLRVPRTQ